MRGQLGVGLRDEHEMDRYSLQESLSDAEEELRKLAQLADRINSQPFVSDSSQNVDLDQLFNFLS